MLSQSHIINSFGSKDCFFFCFILIPNLKNLLINVFWMNEWLNIIPKVKEFRNWAWHTVLWCGITMRAFLLVSKLYVYRRIHKKGRLYINWCYRNYSLSRMVFNFQDNFSVELLSCRSVSHSCKEAMLWPLEPHSKLMTAVYF
jgi:hypothetical protein